MLTAIVLFWIAIKLQAPLWMYIILPFMFVVSLLQFALDITDKVQKKRIEKQVERLTDEQLESFKEWCKENIGK